MKPLIKVNVFESCKEKVAKKLLKSSQTTIDFKNLIMVHNEEKFQLSLFRGAEKKSHENKSGLKAVRQP